MSNTEVFIAFQVNDETRSIVEAIERDNPQARITHMPALVRIDSPGQLTIRRATVEELTGGEWDVQRIHVNLITLSGHVDETDDYFSIGWRNAAVESV